MSVTQSLLNWYDSNARDLPWRKAGNPYRTWISEIMLQQTQVDTVIPYYEKWLSNFPDIQSLALADIDELLKLWEGLGYYSRCRNIHEAAKLMVLNHGALVPDSFEELIKLPGIGHYTAGAILSIGFNKKYPAIDANVIRVMSRLLLVQNSRDNKGKNQISIELENLIPDERPGDFNQALMDLGSMVCKPRLPACTQCPIKDNCLANAKGLQDIIPGKKEKKYIPEYNVVTGMIWSKGKFFIQKRGPSGHLGGLWEFPGGKVESNESLEDALKREIFEECGFHVKVGKKLGRVSHAYSHFKINMTLFECNIVEEPKQIMEPGISKWIFPDEINNYAFPKANHKLFDQIFSE